VRELVCDRFVAVGGVEDLENPSRRYRVSHSSSKPRIHQNEENSVKPHKFSEISVSTNNEENEVLRARNQKSTTHSNNEQIAMMT
jgi:hypothetical protein